MKAVEQVKDLDVVLDTVGSEMLDRSFEVLKPGGVLVSSVALPDQAKAAQHHVQGVFFLVAVTSKGLTRIADFSIPTTSRRMSARYCPSRKHGGRARCWPGHPTCGARSS